MAPVGAPAVHPDSVPRRNEHEGPPGARVGGSGPVSAILIDIPRAPFPLAVRRKEDGVVQLAVGLQEQMPSAPHSPVRVGFVQQPPDQFDHRSAPQDQGIEFQGQAAGRLFGQRRPLPQARPFKTPGAIGDGLRDEPLVLEGFRPGQAVQNDLGLQPAIPGVAPSEGLGFGKGGSQVVAFAAGIPDGAHGSEEGGGHVDFEPLVTNGIHPVTPGFDLVDYHGRSVRQPDEGQFDLRAALPAVQQHAAGVDAGRPGRGKPHRTLEGLPPVDLGE